MIYSLVNLLFTIEDGMDRFKSYVINNPTATIQQRVDELRNIQTMASLRPADRLIIFLGALFSADFITANTIKQQRDMLKALAASDIQQRHLLAAMEWLCGTRFPQLSRLIAKALMQLYDEEIIEEDVFLSWAGDTVRNEYTADASMIEYDTIENIRAFSAPFVKWLQEAEEEGEDGEDDDEEDDEEEEEA